MDIINAFPKVVFPEPNSGCWLCVSNNNWHGYARIRIAGRLVGAHRLSYSLSRGPIPERMQIDHLCRVTCCVNPNHLEIVTQEENKRRQAEALVVCRHGHSRSISFYMHPRGSKQCAECRRVARRLYRKRRQQAAGRFLRRKFLRVLRRAQNNRCNYCGTDLQKGAQIDHKTPLTRGGTNRLHNLQLLCASCNHKKHAKDPLSHARQIGLLPSKRIVP